MTQSEKLRRAAALLDAIDPRRYVRAEDRSGDVADRALIALRDAAGDLRDLADSVDATTNNAGRGAGK